LTVEDLTLRPLDGPGELDLFNRLPYVTNDEFAADLAAGRRRPEWMWVAVRGDRLVARLSWWARRHDDPPFLLDVFDLDDTAPERVETGVRLLETAAARVLTGKRPECLRFVPPGWRADPMGRRSVEDWMTALERTGARLFVERFRLEWRRGAPVPEPRGRLLFRPVDTAEELIELMTGVLTDTLDAHSRADLTRHRAREVAAAQYADEFTGYSPDLWRIATLPDGEPVGFVIPTENAYGPIIAYIGVLPTYRGRGYVDEILGTGTRLLAAQGVERIRASTDLGNVPMARAFERAGYVAYEHQIDMTWS
jgi:RimJ/RimL family protein N-acetyltransferase